MVEVGVMVGVRVWVRVEVCVGVVEAVGVSVNVGVLEGVTVEVAENARLGAAVNVEDGAGETSGPVCLIGLTGWQAEISIPRMRKISPVLKLEYIDGLSANHKGES